MTFQAEIVQSKILIVEDEDISLRIINAVLRKAGFINIISTKDPRQAIKLFEQFHPDLVILDIYMPHVSGFEILHQIVNRVGDEFIPVLILTNDSKREIKLRALEEGAKDFLNKPYDALEVLIRIQNLLEVRVMQNRIRNQNVILESKVKERTQELYDTELDVIQRLSRAVEYRDSETGMHVLRMSHYAACLGERAGLTTDECDIMLIASPLHDIGKIGIPDSILRKTDQLTDEEWTIMKTHTIIGAELLDGSNSKFLKMGRVIALTHHEKWDGSGYPNGFKGTDIPLVGRICGICDVFDALNSKRPYKESWMMQNAIEEIKNLSNTHFDPGLVKCFVDVLPKLLEIKQKYNDPVDQDSNNGSY